MSHESAVRQDDVNQSENTARKRSTPTRAGQQLPSCPPKQSRQEKEQHSCGAIGEEKSPMLPGQDSHETSEPGQSEDPKIKLAKSIIERPRSYAGTDRLAEWRWRRALVVKGLLDVVPDEILMIDPIIGEGIRLASWRANVFEHAINNPQHHPEPPSNAALAAHELFQQPRDGAVRTLVEALYIGGGSAELIAQSAGLPCDVVEWFEFLFFDFRPMLRIELLAEELVCPQSHGPLDRPCPGDLLRGVGRDLGAEAVLRFASPTARKTEDDLNWIERVIRSRILQLALVTSQTVVVMPKNALHILKQRVRQQRTFARRNSRKAADPRAPIPEHR